MDTKPNQYLYNGGSELNEATSNYEMRYRSYDPAIGRMNGVDILAEQFSSLTPYQYAANDPLYYNDPTGAMTDDTPWAVERSRRGKYQYFDSFADYAFQNQNTFGGGFYTYQNFYGSGWNNQQNNGSSFTGYGVTTAMSDGYVNAIIQEKQDAKNGDAQALQSYGARHGVSPMGNVSIMNSLKQAGLLEFNSNGDAGFWSYDTSSPLSITAKFNRFLRGQTQNGLLDVTNKFYGQLARTELFFTLAKELFDNTDFTVPGNRYIEKLRFFAQQVGNNAPFDIKRRGKGFSAAEIGKQAIFEGGIYNYDDFGNINFGFAARIFGISLDDALKGAGLNQINNGNPDWSNFEGYLDHSRDTQMIKFGYNYNPPWSVVVGPK